LAEAPLQAGIQALASSVPIIAGSFLAPPAAAAATAGRVGLGARALAGAKNPATGIGALMGLGGQKGQDYEAVKQELLARGVPEAEAERLAQRAAENTRWRTFHVKPHPLRLVALKALLVLNGRLALLAEPHLKWTKLLRV